jgi:hypothetical protein
LYHYSNEIIRGKLRFSLKKGETYGKWKIKNHANVLYLDPNHYQLTMYGCKLSNKKKVAEKIHKGEYKTVCAWIECEKYILIPTLIMHPLLVRSLDITQNNNHIG